MINDDIISLISVNRNAVATNRGFYYQYLSVVRQWLNHFINDRDTDIYTEVDDDIKEVGDQLVFTQLKCYASSFSLNSREIQKAILNFYEHYLRHLSAAPFLNFRFITNTYLAKHEKLLKRWINDQPLIAGELMNKCTEEVSQLLLKQIKNIRNKRFNDEKLTGDAKSQLIDKFDQLMQCVRNDEKISDFTAKISWTFQELSPEEAVDDLVLRITEDLGHPKFGARPVKLFEALLSEIYRRSQQADPAARKVNRDDLLRLMALKDEELASHVDQRLVQLLDVRVTYLENTVNELKEVLEETTKTQQEHGSLLQQMLMQNDRLAKPLTRNITRIPYLDSATVIGRNEQIEEIHQSLTEGIHASINGNGGMGKSTIIKLYVQKHSGDYDHISWLNTESGLANALVFNIEITQALNIPNDRETFAERFPQILAALKNIPGNNLFVIDDYTDIAPELEELRSLTNWKILLGTRLRLPGWRTVTIDALDFADAKALYVSIDNQNTVTDEELSSFFEAIDYNTLTLRLVAKTINNSLDLTLSRVLEHFQDQDLDNAALQIDITDDNGLITRLLNILKATFDLDELDGDEQYFLMYFAQLPTQDTEIKDLIDWYGIENAAKNSPGLMNVINKLHNRGLIERNGHLINMLQQAVFYHERQQDKPFFSQFLHIPQLMNRIREGAQHDINQSLRYLKYGEAYLENIKEPYRKEIYLAMLQLENEVLNIYNWLYTEDDMVGHWKDLYERASKYFQPNESLLGVISNNLGLALITKGEQEESIPYFDQAAIILEQQGDKAIPQLLISLCNVCHLFVKRGNMQSFMNCFGRIRDVREKYKLWDDVSLPIQSSVLGVANKKIGNYEKAIEMFNLAGHLHLELPKEKRSDLQYVSYLINISECYIATKQLEKAEQAISVTVSLLSKIQAQDTVHLREITKLLIEMCEIKGDREQAAQLTEALEKMGYYSAD